MNEDIMSAASLMGMVFNNLSVDDANKAISITTEWKKIVSRIKSNAVNDEKRNENLGNNIADHSRVVDLKNGVLLVEADHPGWISLLQFYKNFILKGFRMSEKKYEIHNIVFKLSGTKGELYETVEDKEREGMRLAAKQIEEDEKNPLPQESELLLNRKKRELPPELNSIFEDMKKSAEGL